MESPEGVFIESVPMAVGVHPFPSRTRQLSSPAPTILGWRRPGKIGSCRIPQKRNTLRRRVFRFCDAMQLPLFSSHVAGSLDNKTLCVLGWRWVGACAEQKTLRWSVFRPTRAGCLPAAPGCDVVCRSPYPERGRNLESHAIERARWAISEVTQRSSVQGNAANY